MSVAGKMLVVTDLDATLLDHRYAWSAADPAIRELRRRGFPLVLNSSKTLDEMRPLAAALRLDAPIIAENGGVFARPTKGAAAYTTETKGLTRSFILARAHALRVSEDYHFEGFADWTIADITAKTGLSAEAAAASAQRLATEPIDWQDSEANRLRFADALANDGIRMLKGGRFWHLMGQVDKADGVLIARQHYSSLEPDTKWQVLALGDSANDTAMLEAADIAVVIPHADGPHIQPQATRVVHAPFPASEGWNAAVLSILREYP